MNLNSCNTSRCIRLYSLSTVYRSTREFSKKCQNTVTKLTCVHNGQYPTHFTPVRCLLTYKMKKKTLKNSDESDASDIIKFGRGFTYLYAIKYAFYALHDSEIGYFLENMNNQFWKASVLAFLFTSDCLAVKDYYSLEGIVSPSVQTGIEKDQYSVKTVDEVKYVVYQDIYWNYMRFNHNDDLIGKRLAIEVEFTFTREGDFEYKAVFRFVRRYDDKSTDARWIVTEIDYKDGHCYGAYCNDKKLRFFRGFKFAKITQK